MSRQAEPFSEPQSWWPLVGEALLAVFCALLVIGAWAAGTAWGVGR